MHVSRELQETIVSALMKNSYLLSICRSEMNEGYFSDPCCKVIYKALVTYYNKYQNMPRLNELLVIVDEVYYPTCGVNLSEVKDTCCRLDKYDEPDEVFIKNKITDFIRKIRSTNAIKSFLEVCKNSPNLEGEEFVSDLIKALEVQLSTTRVFSMTDPDQVREVRSASVGGSDQSKIIRTHYESLNKCLMFGGWQPSTVNMVVGPPNCLVGSTKIMTLDGNSHTLEEMYESQRYYEIYDYNHNNDRITVGGFDKVVISGYTKELIEVEIDGKYTITCTPDHLFMMRDGEYCEARELSYGDSLMPINREYRTAQKDNGGRLVSKREGYECVLSGSGWWDYTHKISASRIPHSDDKTQIHHIDHDKLNNRMENLRWVTPQEHLSIHWDYNYHNISAFREGFLNNQIKKGEHRSPGTEFDSSRVSKMNKYRWENDENYRKKMSAVGKVNGKNSIMVNALNYDSEFQKRTKVSKVRSFLSRLLFESGREYVDYDEYDELSKSMKTKYRIHLSGIAKAYGVNFEDLKGIWDEVIEDAKTYNHKVTKVTKISLDEEVPVYDIVNASHSNFAVALDECTGVFVHNSGKSMILINEGVNAAKQGFDVLHIFIGDMVEYDGFIRYLSCVSGTPQNSLVMMTQERQMEVVKICNQQYNDVFNRVFMLAYPSLSLTVDAMIEDINKFEKQLNKDFGMIIIDYPDNLILEGRSLYEDGGTLYSSLERLARLSQSVVLTASQPQKAYWNHSIIPLEAAAESSKKQQAVDVMLTFNTEMRGANFGTMLLAKARKGEAGKLFRVQTDFARCKLDEVDEATYNVLKSSYGVVQ